MNCQGYKVELVNEKDSDAIMNLLQRTYFIDEPKNKAIGLYNSGSCPELEDYCRKALLDALSVKAVDAEGNIVGVIVSGLATLKEVLVLEIAGLETSFWRLFVPYISPQRFAKLYRSTDSAQDLISAAENCKNEKLKKIIYVRAIREEGHKLKEKYPEEKQMFVVRLAGTDPAWRNKGIMKALLERTEQIVRQKHIRLLRMDTSSAFSAYSAERNGFTCVYSVKYTEVKMNGEPLVVPEAPHIYDRVYIKDLLS